MKGLQEPSGKLPGAAPAYSTVSDFSYAEFTAQQTAAQDILKISVNRNLQKRKIYCWIWADTSNTQDFWAKATLNFYNQFSQIGSLPISIGVSFGANAPMKASLPTVCTSGGASVGDCIGIYVASPVNNQPSAVVIQPLYLYGEIDEVRFSLIDVRNISTTAGYGVRAWLGVMSSQ
jgi:hypothetical protein